MVREDTGFLMPWEALWQNLRSADFRQVWLVYGKRKWLKVDDIGAHVIAIAHHKTKAHHKITLRPLKPLKRRPLQGQYLWLQTCILLITMQLTMESRQAWSHPVWSSKLSTIHGHLWSYKQTIISQTPEVSNFCMLFLQITNLSLEIICKFTVNHADLTFKAIFLLTQSDHRSEVSNLACLSFRLPIWI